MHNDGLPEILPISEDGVFQSAFIREESKPALKELLSDILDRPLKDVSVRNSQTPMRDKDAKREVFDINCVARDDKAQYDIEMQATPMKGDVSGNEHKHIRNRAVFNLCDLHANQPGRGVRYGDLFYSYQITICNYNVFNWENALVEVFTYRNEGGRQLSDITTAVFIDLTQAGRIAQKPVAEMTHVEQWAVFLAKSNEPEYSAVIEEILKKKEGVSVAYGALAAISKDEAERAHFRSRRMWLQDREHEMAAALHDVNTRWESIVAGKDAALADKDAALAGKDAALAGKDAALAGKDAALADKDATVAEQAALIAQLRARLGE